MGHTGRPKISTRGRTEKKQEKKEDGNWGQGGHEKKMTSKVFLCPRNKKFSHGLPPTKMKKAKNEKENPRKKKE